jgi:hypothetical protein
MKTATSLTLVAIGAILAFAVTAQPSFFSFRNAGWVLIVVGIVGAVVPRRGYGWLRRRLVLTGTGRRVVVDRGQRERQIPKLLQQGVVPTRQPQSILTGEPVELLSDDRLASADEVEKETVEQYTEE